MQESDHANVTSAAQPACRAERWPAHNTGVDEVRQDYFVERDGYRFAGSHLIIDLKGARQLDNLERMEQALRAAVTAAGATLLHLHLHHFTPNGGISGVAVLAESHISVHTWPERAFAAFDVFMCGQAKPERTIPVLEEAFGPCRAEVTEILRGRTAIDDDHFR